MTLTTAEYWERVRAVLHRKAPSCGAKGYRKARCVRDPGHDGAHEGPGFDEWGSTYECWGARR